MSRWPFVGHRQAATPELPSVEESPQDSSRNHSAENSFGLDRVQTLEPRIEVVERELILPTSVEEPNGASKPRAGDDVPLIELRDVTRSFPGDPEVQALKAVNMKVNKGEYVSIVGHSGSGKSTMLNILGLLDRPTVGEYRIDGHLTGSLSEEERAAVRAQRIGFVFQAYHLMPRRSVLNNVLMPMAYAGIPREERHDRAVEALERVGLSHRINFMPGTLSGGERQRVAIARAVATRPSLLLADEPTGALDVNTSDQVMDLMGELNASGLTVMVITHDVDVAARAPRIVQLTDGRLTEGNVPDLAEFEAEFTPALEVAE
jgi:putative ABC transport system ATP-binding protein